MTNLIALIAVVLWLGLGIPYGIKIYRAQIRKGVEKKPAIFKAVIRGAITPLELAVKAMIGAIKEVMKPVE